MPRLESELARTVLSRNLKVRKGESVVIESWTHGLPYVAAFVEETRRLGADPMVLYEDERAWWSSVSGGRPKDVGRMSRSEKAALKAADVYVYFWGPEDRPRADALPERIANSAFDFNEGWYGIGQKQGLRGCRMSVAYATDPAAKVLGLDGTRWRRQIAAAGLADARHMQSTGDKVAARLEKGKELRIHHKNGTDLTLGLVGRKARVEAGIVDKAAKARPYGFLTNSPAGTVLVALDEKTAEGVIVSNQAYIQPGFSSSTGRWEFSGGKLLSYAYENGHLEVQKKLDSLGEGKDRPGMFGLGLNAKGRGIPQYEEIEAGMSLLGIGGNAFLGGKTQLPFQLYSMLRGADVEIDGTPIVRGGRVG
ncbi:MAG: aminopeptidase [Thermoplasmata archaeon]|nr:aminopeptidase [Thermoplasmata archaeon]